MIRLSEKGNKSGFISLFLTFILFTAFLFICFSNKKFNVMLCKIPINKIYCPKFSKRILELMFAKHRKILSNFCFKHYLRFFAKLICLSNVSRINFEMLLVIRYQNFSICNNSNIRLNVRIKGSMICN